MLLSVETLKGSYGRWAGGSLRDRVLQLRAFHILDDVEANLAPRVL